MAFEFILGRKAARKGGQGWLSLVNMQLQRIISAPHIHEENGVNDIASTSNSMKTRAV
jgi:hypothetical protein